MKPNIIAFIGLLTLGLTSCNDFLDQEPLSSLSPESFYTDEGQVQAASNKLYQDIMPNHDTWNYGHYSYDNGTDNQTNKYPGSRFATDLWLVSNSNGNWNWANVRNVNYQLNQVLSKYNAGAISGTDANIRQAIGEMYFFRALATCPSLLRLCPTMSPYSWPRMCVSRVTRWHASSSPTSTPQ